MFLCKIVDHHLSVWPHLAVFVFVSVSYHDSWHESGAICHACSSFVTACFLAGLITSYLWGTIWPLDWSHACEKTRFFRLLKLKFLTISVRSYVWLEMPQLSTTDMLWRMWSHCSNNRSTGGFRPTPISVLDWSQREKSSLSTTPKPTCLFSKENHNVLVCRKSHWNQLCASASWLAR